MSVAQIIPIGKAKPDDYLIERIEALLVRAKSGELRTLMWIGELTDGSRTSGYTPCEDSFMLLADAARLQHNIQLRLDANTSSEPGA